MSINTLLAAAEYLERREREAEHGYASPIPIPVSVTYVSKRRTKTKKSQGNRTTHNELEKNRRAHLRSCLDTLKDLVPLGPDSSRHTTLGLLNNATSFIKMLEDKEHKNLTAKEQLRREQRFLKRRLQNLTGTSSSSSEDGRSMSESGSSSRSSTSETDEVDIMGFNTNPSDTDDHSSIQSITSDGGMAISTKRLCLVEGKAV